MRSTHWLVKTYNTYMTGGRFHKLFLHPTPLRPTFAPKKASQNVGRRRRANMDRAISMICAGRPTFMKSTLGGGWVYDTQSMSCALVKTAKWK